MPSRGKYEKILKILSGKKVRKTARDATKVSELLGRFREELAKPDLAVNSIYVILEKIQSALGGGLPVEVQKIVNSTSHYSTALDLVPCKLAKTDIWSSDIKRRPYLK